MTDYVTLDDLLVQIGHDELAQVAGTGSHNAPEGRLLDEPKIQKQIDFTNELISGYLVGLYPFVSELDTAQAPELIRGFACDIVRYRLRPRSGDRNTVTEEVRNRFDDAMKWLKEASKGLVEVPFEETLKGGGDVTGSPAGEVRAALQPSRAPEILNGYAS